MTTATVDRVALDDALAKELRTAGRKSDEWRSRRDELIWLAHLDGASLREISRAVGLSNPGVLRVIRRKEQFEKLADAGIIDVTHVEPPEAPNQVTLTAAEHQELGGPP